MSIATADRVIVPWSIDSSIAPLDSALKPVLTSSDFRRLADDKEWQALERMKCQRDPWYALVNLCVTVDERYMEKGLPSPYRRFPATQPMQSYAHVMFTEPHSLWPKSRQQLLTWLATSMSGLESLFAEARLVLIQSKRWEDSKKALKRFRGVYGRLRGMAPWLVPELVKDDVAEIGFSNNSTIMAVPSGENYVQSNTPSHWICDETQLQDPSTKLAFEQALPAVGRIMLIGSADYSWFWQTLLQGKQE